MRRALVAAAAAAALLVTGLPGGRASAADALTLTYNGTPVRIVTTPLGVPHITAATTPAAMYGFGYAGARDRLWIADVYLRVAEGRLSELLGPVVTEAERAYVRTGYTDEEAEAIFKRLPADVQGEMQAYADGFNQYIAEAETDPAKLPHEFVMLGNLPIDRVTPVRLVRFAQLLALSPSGGVPIWGNVNLLRRLQAAYGSEQGRAKFDDLVRETDPDTYTTIPRDTKWKGTPTAADLAVATPLRSHVADARLTPPSSDPAPAGPLPPLAARVPHNASADKALAAGAINDLARRKAAQILGSNEQFVTPKLSASKNSLMTAGPQTDYTGPGTYWEAAVTVPGQWSLRGMSIPPFPWFAVGRGPGYVWTVTNEQQGDSADVYAEKLDPADPRRYIYDGKSEAMACRTHNFTFHGVPFDSQEVCRTRHGPVISFDEPNGLAFSERHVYWGREDRLLLAFQKFTRVRSLKDMATAAAILPASWNLAYADDEGNTAWWLTGYYPKRAPGREDVRLVRDGTGGDEWQGVVAFEDQPHVINPKHGWLVNWNNYPVEGWRSGRVPYYAARVEKLRRAFEEPGTQDPFGGPVTSDDKWDAADLTANLRLGSYADDGWVYMPALPDAADLKTPLARRALEFVRGWKGFAVDRDGDGFLDQAAATIMRRWQSVARTAIFADDLGPDDLGFVHDYGELWRILSPDATGTFKFDWLDGKPRRQVAAETFEQAVSALAASFGNENLETWRSAAPLTRYAHFNYNLFLDAAETALCDQGQCPRPRDGLPLPGYVQPHHAMNRGVFNQIVQYLDKPKKLAESRVSACSVVTPGNSGLVNALGQESPNFQDQAELYAAWRFHDNALTPDELAKELAGGDCVPASME